MRCERVWGMYKGVDVRDGENVAWFGSVGYVRIVRK